MNDFLRRSYYALVWNTSLKKNVEIRGKLIDKNTKLPQDENILYGTNDNDVMKIRIVEYENEIHYNAKTMEQSVRFNPIVEEFILPRDIRIVVWNDSEYMNPKKDRYKIMTPQDFKEMVSMEKYTSSEKLMLNNFEGNKELSYSNDMKENLEEVNIEDIDFQFEIFKELNFDRISKFAGTFV